MLQDAIKDEKPAKSSYSLMIVDGRGNCSLWLLSKSYVMLLRKVHQKENPNKA
jgi:hypothetical protein